MSAFTLHLMRHGAPTTPNLLLGKTDAPATPDGIAACLRAADALHFDAVIASDLQRCAETARMISKPRGLTATIDARWRELDFGAWDGRASEDIGSDAMAPFWRDPDANPPPGGERWSAIVARVAAALDDLAPRDTLIVTHGGAIRAALACLFDFEYPQLWSFDLPYAAIVSLRLWPGSPRAAQIVGLRA